MGPHPRGARPCAKRAFWRVDLMPPDSTIEGNSKNAFKGPQHFSDVILQKIIVVENILFLKLIFD